MVTDAIDAATLKPTPPFLPNRFAGMGSKKTVKNATMATTPMAMVATRIAAAMTPSPPTVAVMVS